jgi:cyclic pyranopterin monophosphate synthase
MSGKWSKGRRETTARRRNSCCTRRSGTHTWASGSFLSVHLRVPIGSLVTRVPIPSFGTDIPYTVVREGRDSLMTDRSLSHLDPFGGTRMVDVSPKEATHRRALARCKVVMRPETTAKVANNAITKGDVLAAARVAGIQAAKRTADLVPMCHPLLVGAVHVDFTIGDDYVEVESKVEAVDRTGVEMEAMTACAIAALTVYDMCKTTDRTMSIGELMLWEKSGGTSGVWKRDSLHRPM